MARLLGGWRVFNKKTIQSGQRLTVNATNVQNVFGIVTDRAPFSNTAACSNHFVNGGSVQDKLDNYINASCFDLAAYPVIGADGIGTAFGNSGIGEVTGPNQNNWDLAVIKRVGLTSSDRLFLDFRAEFFNAFNHPQFANPDLNAGTSAPQLLGVFPNPTFGHILSSSTNPRIIQLAVKLTF